MGVPYAEVVGDPIGHSKSPLIHRFWIEKLGIDAAYQSVLVPRWKFTDYVTCRRDDPDWRGCSVTMPHKEAACCVVDLLHQPAHRASSVNCIARKGDQLCGFNTDLKGFIEPLEPEFPPRLREKTIQIVGAGSAARTAALALESSGALGVSFYNRSLEKAQKLSIEFRGHPDNGFGLDELRGVPDSQGRTPWTLLVNATPLGMEGFPPLNVDLSPYPKRTIIYDMVYHPVETPLLSEARAKGLVMISGIDMLIGQAAPAFEHFFGVPAPREHDDELRRLLLA